VAIENSKELDLRPSLTLLIGWLLNVEHNRNAVFVVLSDNALISIGSIGFDNSVFFN